MRAFPGTISFRQKVIWKASPSPSETLPSEGVEMANAGWVGWMGRGLEGMLKLCWSDTALFLQCKDMEGNASILEKSDLRDSSSGEKQEVNNRGLKLGLQGL